MGEEKPEPLDFVKDFQEYLSQQTQHVNMISGSVIGVKDSDDLQGGNLCLSDMYIKKKIFKHNLFYDLVIINFHINITMNMNSIICTYHKWGVH